MLFQSTNTTVTFSKWLYAGRENRRLLSISALLVVVQFIWFKIELPYPIFVQESYTYLQAATNNDFINMLPIGYSKYLQLTGLISHANLLPVLVQYLFLEAAIVYFFMTLGYLFQPGKWLLRILIIITIINPLLLRVSNLLIADALFAAVSLVWFTQLLWLLYKPARPTLAIHTFIVFAAVTLQDTAIYYPFFSIAVLYLSTMRLQMKLACSGLIILLLVVFAGATQYTYHKRTGVAQLSAGRGWQAANNILYAYAHDPQDTSKTKYTKFRQLHALVNHRDSVKYQRRKPDESLGNYYSEDKSSPLYDYTRADTSKPEIKSAVNRRLMMGSFYSRYADWLMKQHREAYFKHFILPNAIKYFVPEPEHTGFILQFGTIESVAIKWFHLLDNRYYTYPEDNRILIINYMPGLVAMSSLGFFLGIILCWSSERLIKTSSWVKRKLVLALVVMLFHATISVILRPVVLRMQVFSFYRSI